jgi:hypothetical protein
MLMPPTIHPQTAITQVSIINESTVLTDAEVMPVVIALQQQVTNDFRPAWGIDAELKMIPLASPPPSGSWWLVILDDPDQAGALGYHDLTPDGLPMGKVFAASDIKAGTSWSVTASHELLEMLADPNINLSVLVQNTETSGTLYAYEVCDICEDDSFGYQIKNIAVSDFVYPAWFETFRPEGTQFDRMSRIQRPLQLLPGGYIGVFNIAEGGGWQQQTAEKNPVTLRHRGQVGTRRERRSVLRTHWITSLPQRKIISNAQQYRQHLQTILRRQEAA